MMTVLGPSAAAAAAAAAVAAAAVRAAAAAAGRVVGDARWLIRCLIR